MVAFKNRYCRWHECSWMVVRAPADKISELAIERSMLPWWRSWSVSQTWILITNQSLANVKAARSGRESSHWQYGRQNITPEHDDDASDFVLRPNYVAGMDEVSCWFYFSSVFEEEAVDLGCKIFWRQERDRDYDEYSRQRFRRWWWWCIEQPYNWDDNSGSAVVSVSYKWRSNSQCCPYTTQ